MRFHQSKVGLYYYDTEHQDFSLLNTVSENKSFYTPRQRRQADEARRVYVMIGRPSMKDYENIVRLNLIPDCPVTIEDIRTANKIYGAEIAALKGKTTRNTSPQVRTDQVHVPPEIKEIHQLVTIAIDLMFVNKIPFFVTISRNIKFTTIQHLENRTKTSLCAALKCVYDIYKRSGFSISTVLADGEFNQLEIFCIELGLTLKTTAANEHVPDIERQLRVIKERARAIRCTLPFDRIPKRVIIEMMSFVVFWLNLIPNKNGVSSTLGPRNIVTNTRATFRDHCGIPFGAYAQMHKEPHPSNDISIARTQGGICLGPTGNPQGGYKFLNLNTGMKVTRRSFTEIPTPQEVIDRVNYIVECEKQGQALIFQDRYMNAIVDDEMIDVQDATDPDITGVEPDNPPSDDHEQTINEQTQQEIETQLEEPNEEVTIHSTKTDEDDTEADIAGVTDPDPEQNQDTQAQTTVVAEAKDPEDDPNLETTDTSEDNESDSSSDDEETDDGEVEIENSEVYHPSTMTQQKAQLLLHAGR